MVAIILANGQSVYFSTRSGNCTSARGTSDALKNTCANIYIDTNGAKPPNTFGHDIFWFYAAKNSIIPVGGKNDTNHPFDTACKTTGIGCLAWVILNENMDYLHCDDLSWDGPRKCN